MNLEKLFKLQKELDEHIYNEHPVQDGEDRLAKKILALQVELGELANEWRGFKYWSHDQEPRKSVIKFVRYDKPPVTRNLVLEEFVDGIHFLLSIGLENGIEELDIKPIKKNTLTEQFLGLYNVFSLLHISFSQKTYSEAWSAYVWLAEMLGLRWDDVEAAYFEKNAMNHARQESGY